MAEESKVPVATLEYEPTAFELLLLKHKSKLILVGALAVVGTLGYWGWRLVKESKHESAALDFTRATTVDQLKKAAADHAGQTAAGNALILAADKLFAENKGSEAIASVKDFLAQYPEHPLRDLATWKLGEYLSAAGDPAGAAKEYEAVAQGNSPFAGVALLRLGDMKWGAGELDKAKEYYTRITTSQSLAGNPARDKAQQRMDIALKLKAPTPVELLLPPPKLNTGGSPGQPGPGGFEGLPPGLNIEGLPPNLKVDSEPFIPPVPPSDKPINAPSLLDDPPALPPGDNK